MPLLLQMQNLKKFFVDFRKMKSAHAIFEGDFTIDPLTLFLKSPTIYVSFCVRIFVGIRKMEKNRRIKNWVSYRDFKRISFLLFALQYNEAKLICLS